MVFEYGKLMIFFKYSFGFSLCGGDLSLSIEETGVGGVQKMIVILLFI